MTFDELYRTIKEDVSLLQEMPIGQISRTSDIFGADDIDNARGDHVRKADLKLMRSKDYADNLKKTMFLKTPYTFNIIFNDHSNMTKSIFHDTNIDNFKPKRKQITVILNNTAAEGGNRVITPWIIAHRIGHSVMDYRFDQKAYKGKIKGVHVFDEDYGRYTFGQIVELLTEYFRKIDSNYESGNIKSGILGASDNYPDIYEKISDFKTARTRSVASFEEYIHELVAEFLTKGKIIFKNIPDQRTSQHYADKLNALMIKLFDRIVGTVIVVNQ